MNLPALHQTIVVTTLKTLYTLHMYNLYMTHIQFYKFTNTGDVSLSCTNSQIVGSQVVVRGNLSFTDNNAENYLGGAVYISAFGQIKLYRGAEINFVGNIGRYVLTCKTKS